MAKMPFTRPVVVWLAQEAPRVGVGPSQVTARQLGPGELRARALRVVLVESLLEQNAVTSDVLLRGHGRPGHVTFVFAARMPRSVIVASRWMCEGFLLCYGPDAEFDGVQPAGSVVFVMAVPTERLSGTVLEIGGQRVDVRARAVVVEPSADRRRHLEALLDEVAEMAEHRPETLDDERHRMALEAALLESWLIALAAADAEEGSSEASSRASELASRLDECIARPDSPRPTVAEACEVLGASRRSLERAILAARGMSPADYIRRLRIHAVRADLLDPTQAGRRITDIALDHGFSHPGRLASQYRLVFGETPSETRNRIQLV